MFDESFFDVDGDEELEKFDRLKTDTSVKNLPHYTFDVNQYVRVMK
ncbi:hypothetical protein [Methanolapillus millepedarum]